MLFFLISPWQVPVATRVTYVERPLNTSTTWRNINVFIPEKNHINVRDVVNVSHTPAPTVSTWIIVCVTVKIVPRPQKTLTVRRNLDSVGFSFVPWDIHWTFLWNLFCWLWKPFTWHISEINYFYRKTSKYVIPYPVEIRVWHKC